MNVVFVSSVNPDDPSWSMWTKRYSYQSYRVVPPETDLRLTTDDVVFALKGIPFTYWIYPISPSKSAGRSFSLESRDYPPEWQSLLEKGRMASIWSHLQDSPSSIGTTFWAQKAALELKTIVNIEDFRESPLGPIGSYLDLLALYQPFQEDGNWWLASAQQKGLITPATIRWGYSSEKVSFPEVGLEWEEKDYPRAWVSVLLGFHGDPKLVELSLGLPEDVHLPTVRSLPIIGVGAIIGRQKKLFEWIREKLKRHPVQEAKLAEHLLQLINQRITYYQVDHRKYPLLSSKEITL